MLRLLGQRPPAQVDKCFAQISKKIRPTIGTLIWIATVTATVIIITRITNVASADIVFIGTNTNNGGTVTVGDFFAIIRIQVCLGNFV